MTIAVVDNGSLEPGAHLNLRRVAKEISARLGVRVQAVSWRHSDRIPPDQLGDATAPVIAEWLPAQLAQRERTFLFVPFFISGQGAIGSALRADLEGLRDRLGGFEFQFAEGLAARDALVPILIDRIRETISREKLGRPAVIVVDHGGPSTASAELRDEIARRIGANLTGETSRVAAASLEGHEFTHNWPLLADLLATRGFSQGEVVVAPLFLTPGRHGGPGGDIAAIVTACRKRTPDLQLHVAELVGTHRLVSEVLAGAVRDALATGAASASPPA